MLAIEALALRCCRRRSDLAAPDGFNACDNHCANENHCHGSVFGIEDSNQTFVPGKQLVYVFRSGLIDRIKVTRDVNRFAQCAVAWHVYAVVVPW